MQITDVIFALSDPFRKAATSTLAAEETAHPVRPPSYDAADRAKSRRYRIDHIAAMATAMPTSRMIQKDTSEATPIAHRSAANTSSAAARTMFVPLCHPRKSVCRAHTAKTMTATAAAASATLFIAPAGFAKMAL